MALGNYELWLPGRGIMALKRDQDIVVWSGTNLRLLPASSVVG
jgi:hypothetical protein